MDDDESLSEGGAAREHDPEDESDLDLGNSSDDDNAVARMRNRSAAARASGGRRAGGGGPAIGTRSKTSSTSAAGRGRGKAWEGQFERTWDQVQEDEHGTLEGAVSDLLLSAKSRRSVSASPSLAASLGREGNSCRLLETAQRRP